MVGLFKPVNDTFARFSNKYIMRIKQSLLVSFLVFSVVANSQTATSPKITTYFSVYHTIATYSQNTPTYIFGTSNYTVGFPIGINVYKNPKVGFSFEFTPFITSTNSAKAGTSQSKLSELLFHPGLLIPLKHGFSMTERIALSTSGRYGLTQVFTKVLAKDNYCSYYMSIPIGVRFGNENSPTPATSAVNNMFVGACFGVAF